MRLVAADKGKPGLGGIAPLLFHLAAAAGGLGAAQGEGLVRSMRAAAKAFEGDMTPVADTAVNAVALALGDGVPVGRDSALLIRPVALGDFTGAAGEVQRLCVVVGRGCRAPTRQSGVRSGHQLLWSCLNSPSCVIIELEMNIVWPRGGGGNT